MAEFWIAIAGPGVSFALAHQPLELMRISMQKASEADFNQLPLVEDLEDTAE